MNLLMLSLDTETVEGHRGAFYNMLEVFHRHWERIDVITPAAKEVNVSNVFGNVHLHATSGGKAGRVRRIVAIGRRLMAERDYDFMIAHDSGLFQTDAPRGDCSGESACLTSVRSITCPDTPGPRTCASGWSAA